MDEEAYVTDDEELLPPMPLTREQRRVLGVLIEKAFATPESYPLTLNAAVSGCNQKSAREPVMDLSSDQVADALSELKELGLVECIFPASGRTERWRHVLKEAWGLDGRQRAVLAELLLRGPQSEGDLRGRASRLQELTSLDDANAVLASLTEEGFARRLSPEHVRRGVVWTHLLFPDDEFARVVERFKGRAGDEDEEATTANASPTIAVTTTAPTRAVADDRLSMLEAQVQDLRGKLADLSDAYDALLARIERMTG
jgi:uncharacterized protein YceH (UPF0502 family)